MRKLPALFVWLPFVLSVSSAGNADPLPFPNGRYVTDERLCDLTEDAMIAAHGDMVGAFVRNIDGPALNNGYEMFCSVSNVKLVGQRVFFDAYCDAEGEKELVRGKYIRISDTSFRLGDRLFSLCTSEQEEFLYADVTTPTEVLVHLWHESNSDCRGLYPSNAKMHTGCAARDIYDRMLSERDWCYGRGDQPEYEKSWHACAPDSMR